MPQENRYDAFLSYNHNDQEWVQCLASKIESEQHGDRHLKVFFDKQEIVPGHNMVEAMENGLRQSRYICPIISPNSVGAEWPKMEWAIAISSDPSGRRGKVIPIWLGGCEIPPALKIRNVLYFNNDVESVNSYQKLISILKGDPSTQPINPYTTPSQHSESFPMTYEDDVNEQLLSNLFQVLQMPKIIWHGPTKHTNREI